MRRAALAVPALPGAYAGQRATGGPTDATGARLLAVLGAGSSRRRWR